MKKRLRGSIKLTTKMKTKNVFILGAFTVAVLGLATIGILLYLNLGNYEINGNLTVKNNLTLNNSGSLIITGNLSADNGAGVTINGGGNVKVSGSATFNNNATLLVKGVFQVVGALTFGNNESFSGTGTSITWIRMYVLGWSW